MQYTINTLDQLRPILIGFRKSKGLTQKELAEKIGVSQQNYQVLEKNPQKVTVERLFKVLNLLGVKVFLSEHDGSRQKEKTAKDEW
jgi:HTH-type transcriptional regulator / antitoxin HipB